MARISMRNVQKSTVPQYFDLYLFAEVGIDLIGVEGQSVGPEDAPMAVHKVLLSVEVVLLEGIRLGSVAEGAYVLNAAPISLAGSDSAPCRAILMGKETCTKFGG